MRARVSSTLLLPSPSFVGTPRSDLSFSFLPVEKILAKNPSRERGAGCPRVVPGYDGWWYRVIDGNWKFDWQVFDVVVVDFKLAARRRREMTGRV